MLYGIPIVALVIDGYERLCLAQISNTLLKTFSYNEIHNRRVALGITCVQCTPVQLELLRRAGAMPVSSRRCGLITKREAERLCKSFLADTKPPKLPDNFAFEVIHNCAWGCRGSFVPSRYNSSRAKCIKCTYCGLFFSPNKFIFHSHRLPDSKYVQPDAANFNSWRRHIKLGGTPPEEVIYAWEDVKAMFNGGSRKRIMSCASESRGGDHHKRSRASTVRSDSTTTINDAPPQAKPPYFPVVPLPNKGFSLQPAPPFGPPSGPPFAMAAAKPLSPADIRQTFAEYMWAGKSPFQLPYGGVLWPRPAGLVPQPPPVELRDNRNPPQSCPTSSLPYGLADTTTIVDSGRPLSSASEGTTRSYPDHPEGSPSSPLLSSQQQPSPPPMPPHTSAFRPVGRIRTLHVEAAAADTVDTTTAGGGFDLRADSRCSSDQDEVDVTDISDDGEAVTSHGACADDLSGTPPALIAVNELTSAVPDTSGNFSEKKMCRKEEKHEVADSAGSQDDELKEVLLQEAEARRRAEREYQMIRDTFEEQVRKEIAYREEVAKQLQIVREAHDALHHFSCKMLASRHCTECGYKPSLPE